MARLIFMFVQLVRHQSDKTGSVVSSQESPVPLSLSILPCRVTTDSDSGHHGPVLTSLNYVKREPRGGQDCSVGEGVWPQA